MAAKVFVVLSALAVISLAQRSPYAGRRPIGYPELQIPTTTVANDLGNRFGDENAPSTTTMRLPIEALGDRNLFDRLNKLPLDQQPFWLINWKALEALRKNPQTYQQKPSSFGDISKQNPSIWLSK